MKTKFLLLTLISIYTNFSFSQVPKGARTLAWQVDMTESEDYDLAFRFRKQGLKIAPIKKIIHHWRDYETRTSRTDKNYADNQFHELKVKHFLAQDYQIHFSLILWGAGRKGKKIAQLLLKQGISFEWICNNPKKIGKHIYSVQLKSLSRLKAMKSQIIIAVSSPNDASTIDTLITTYKQHQYFRFC